MSGGTIQTYRMDSDALLRVMLRAWTDGFKAAVEVAGQPVSPAAVLERVKSIKVEIDKVVEADTKRAQRATLVSPSGAVLVQ